jgi:hypothetical protein
MACPFGPWSARSHQPARRATRITPELARTHHRMVPEIGWGDFEIISSRDS